MDITTEQFFLILGLTTFAGLATGIGGAIGFFVKKTNTKLLTFALGLSGGVMVYISFVELFAGAQHSLSGIHGKANGYWMALAAFFGGMFIAGLIDKLIPEDENPHEARESEDMGLLPVSAEGLSFAAPEVQSEGADVKLPHPGLSAKSARRSGLLFALAIGVHNFPEGLATFAAGMSSLSVGIPIAIAIALHNIPEGIAVSVPIYYGTGSRKKAFFYSLLAGIAEPVGALLGLLILLPFLGPTVLALLFAFVAGIMVFISFDELLPMSERWGHHHLSLYGIVSGMALMGATLALLA